MTVLWFDWYYMPSGKLKVGSTEHAEVIKKTTTNNIKKSM